VPWPRTSCRKEENRRRFLPRKARKPRTAVAWDKVPRHGEAVIRPRSSEHPSQATTLRQRSCPSCFSWQTNPPLDRRRSAHVRTISLAAAAHTLAGFFLLEVLGRTGPRALCQGAWQVAPSDVVGHQVVAVSDVQPAVGYDRMCVVRALALGDPEGACDLQACLARPDQQEPAPLCS